MDVSFSSFLCAREKDISFCFFSKRSQRPAHLLREQTFTVIINPMIAHISAVIHFRVRFLTPTHCVTYTRQQPSLSPRSTYFFACNWSSSFWMAATLMPVTSRMSASVSVGCDCIAFSIFE